MWSSGSSLVPALLISCAAHLSMDRKMQKNQNVAYFPWWANGPYSPGLGSCAGVIECLMFEDDTYTQNGSGWVSEVDGHCFYPLW